MSKNGMATYTGSADYVNLTHLPNPKTEYVVNFEKLTGGLNLYDPDYRLKTNESPDMENMLWKNGTLCSRYGQDYTDADDTRGEGYTCFDDLYYGYAFFHIGNKIWYAQPGADMTLLELCDLSSIYNDYTPARGTFLRYRDALVYKAPGVFINIQYGPGAEKFSGDGTTKTFTLTTAALISIKGVTVGGTDPGDWSAEGNTITFETAPASGTNNIVVSYMSIESEDVSSTAYTPITYINASWRNGSGDSYQPENRLSANKTIWYNAGTDESEQKFSGDGTTTTFTITLTDFVYVTDVRVDGASVGNWTVSGTSLIFYSAPASGTNNIVVTCQCAVKTYYLPVKATSIVSIYVDGVAMVENTDFTYDSSTGLITFANAPTVTQPLSNNTVRVTYSLANDDAFNSIMDCPYAIVYGGAQNICMVVGGCKAQANAFFWNGNNIAMDLSYWPMEQYNLGGDNEDAITGFGRQQGMLVVFKNRSVGKAEMSFTTVEVSSDTTARVYIEMDYTQINSRIGCDLPWSIQLIDNNLVFCNSQQGVQIILDSSAAYENNIIEISKKVNGDNGRTGLLQRVRDAARISSFDDNKRYWLIMDDKVFCWDYVLSEYKDPSWFYLTGVDAPAMLLDVDTIYHLDHEGRVVVFNNSYADYGQEMERRYQFATQFFRSYDRLKTVTVAIFTFRPDTDFQIEVKYLNDYEERKDLTDIVCRSWRLSPRNLRWRDMSVVPFAYVARRRPGCRHVRHFSTVLTCRGVGYDMPILSAQVMYKYEGRDR